MPSRRSPTHGISHVAAALFALALAPPVALHPLILSPAFAADQQSTEAADFEAAKALGTVEAWDAFLSHHPTGFHADLARAYVKKLAEQPAATQPATPPPQAAAQPPADYPMIAGSWGGIVRAGPGPNNAKVGSLTEGEEVTLLAPPVTVTEGDYPWFKIAFGDGITGYMWGGLICSVGAERADMFKLCTFTPVRGGSNAQPAEAPAQRPAANGERPSWCSGSTNGAETAICQNADLISLDQVMNVAYRRAKSDSPNAMAEIEQEQRRWLGRRNLCGNDPACVRKRYAEQIQLLESYYGN